MSYKPQKKGVGSHKQFGPIQKLTVPDFQHITNQYEQMQNEILDKPGRSRKQVKNFSIRKLTNPNQIRGAQQAAADAINDARAQGFAPVDQGPQRIAERDPNSLLTEEEHEALKPHEVKVDNPWIHKQTHQEYLQNIKGLPARHANVIHKHENVQKDATFIPKVEVLVDKDQATKDAIALLNREYEIFNTPGLQGVKVLTRYDTWDEDYTVEDWVSYCRSRPGQAHALSPVYQGYEYCWKPVEVLSYEYKDRKFKVKVISTGQEKLVTRLSLLFFNEDPEQFKARVNQCKQRQEIVEAELRFTDLVDRVPTDSVSTLSKEHRFYFLSKSVRDSDKFDPDKIYGTFKNLLRVVEEEYIRQMKKCVILKQMEDPANYQKFARQKVPIRLSKKTSPYFGVVRCPKYSFSYHYEEIKSQHFSSDEALVSMTRIFIQKCIDFQQQRFMQTDLSTLKLPRELDDLERLQKEHHKATQQNMMIQWREFLVGEIMERLREGHDFFLSDSSVYEESGLKRIITRFEYILNTYLREFVKLSVDDWVKFIRYFTNPNLNNDELWRVNTKPCITIHLSIKKKDKKKKDAKKDKKDKAKEEDAAAVPEEEKEDDQNRVTFKPTIEECEKFVLSSMDMIVDSTNKVFSLESDLMPFLERPGRPNFQIDYNNEWIVDAKNQLSTMINANISQPNELLEKYKKFEYIINIDKKALIDDLFKGGEEGGKKDIEEIREQIKHFDQAHYDIMTLSQDEVDYRVFQVVCKKLKQELGDQANKMKDLIMTETYKYCNKTVQDLADTFTDMQNKIEHDPQSEHELVATQGFIGGALAKQEELLAELKIVEQHYDMLDSFSFQYEQADINAFYIMKIWPQQIQASLAGGRSSVAMKRDEFNTRLETEKENFMKQLTQFQQTFEKIQTFKDKNEIGEFQQTTYELNSQLTRAFDKVKEFNERETVFEVENSIYPDLGELSTAFKPFCDLITMGAQVTSDLKDWKNERLHGRDPEHIRTCVAEWQGKCQQLAKKLDDDHPDTAQVARDLRKDIDEFAKNLPLIRCFTSEAIGVEDWNEIVELIGHPIEKEEVKVSEFEDLKLYDFVPDIEEIAMRAEKKFGLKQKLIAYRQEMKRFELEQKSYKVTTYLLKGYDDVMTKLDELIVGTQTMLGSSYMKGSLKVETQKWETTLNNISELMESMMKTQRNWMYLEPIFSSGDISATMPLEARMFGEVDALWRKTMDSIHDEPGIMELTEKEGIKNSFDDANRKLDRIQKSLNDYLEQKRLIFARFFFLGSDELLQILANTKDPLLVQPYMNKCFEGINAVQFDDNLCVYGMVSEEGETVQFLNKINVNEGDRKGNVEKWMLDIESAMRAGLKDLAKRALQAYPTTVRTEWTKMWPGQIVLAISQIFWTGEVEKSVEAGTLADYLKVQQSQIEDIVKIVRTPLKDMERITLKALVVIDVHARDVCSMMLRKNIQNITEFTWSSQLRYYWEDKDVLRVKMVTAIIDYAYEYLGNSPRLVITELTDRCYRTLLGAKFLNYGGAPEGPAGTGKTESVKDLAKAIAVQCVVFNCSDGIDYLFMAQYFKGLAQSGAWCCFDEFNRIDLEVLSVIAQQVLCIQDAVKNKKVRVFEFMETQLTINRNNNVNITMNPGYAGRSALPDNLKALFRPCAMMVPDYALIAQIELFSFGFSDAVPLSVKVVASLRLSSEQLSSQDHYDFGMRAVKSILNACGNNRRILADWAEDLICLKALNDVNLPKFTSNDIPLYKGITSDLFPGVTMQTQDYSTFIGKMEESCVNQNIQPKPIFIQKCIELYETMLVRHGLMVVGDAFAGKSCVIKTLRDAFSLMEGDPRFVPVLDYYVNPKAITQNQLYGVYNMDTQEWSDGVLAIKIRDAAESTTKDKKWIVFDGPVDAIWIENMNTVLDDNKKLCLNSGQIIKLKPTMTIMFQTDDLSQASPATISRVGMVLLESAQLGHEVFIKSYCQDLRSFTDAKIVDKFQAIFNYVADVCFEFTRMNCKFPTPGNSRYLVAHMCRILELYVKPHRPVESEDDEPAEHELPKDFDEKLSNALIFAAIWGIGGVIEESTRPRFDEFLQSVLNADEVIETHNLDLGNDDAGNPKSYEPAKIPNKIGGEYKSLFELYFDQEEMRWVNWTQTVDKYTINKEHSFLQLSIPTIDMIRTNHLCKTLLQNNMHALLIGPTGTGKSMSVMQMLKSDFDNDEYTYYTLGFSAQTSANQTELIIDGSMEKKKRGVFGPGMNKQGVIFVDDLNMPQKEVYGAQPPIELLRQFMDYGGWYDIENPEREFRSLINCRFIAAMGRNTITSRYIRHFNTIYCEPYSAESLSQIFSTILDWMFATATSPAFGQPITALKDQIVNNTVHVFQLTCENFRPTPAKSHYSYNLRDISKVFQGIAKSSAKAIIKEDDMIKLWAHECTRVFQDRLVNEDDRTKFDELLKGVVKEKFKREWDNLVKIQPLLFASFVPLCYPGGDNTKKPYNDVYCELSDREKTKKNCEDSLVEFNQQNPSKKMDLVLFTAAIEHVVKIHRIITTEFGHALLIGVGGSGRKSCTELATAIAEYETFKIEITKSYNFEAWREDMRDKLYMDCGTSDKSVIFLLNDTQIVLESFLEDINNILNNGEIPNLFSTMEEKSNVQEAMLELNKATPGYKGLSAGEIWADFIGKCKQKVHCVLAMSPIGEDFRRRLRMFPALVNCCAIDYFLPWPEEALTSVAEHFIKDVEDLPEKEGIVKICVDMQLRVTKLSDKYYAASKQRYYVTPTSYLVLIRRFKDLLNKKRDQIDDIIHKYDSGIKELALAKTKVNELQQELTELMPQLVEAKKENDIIKVKVEAKKIDVAAETKIVEKEAAAANETKSKADAIQHECEYELSNVMPIFQRAQRAVGQLKNDDVTELKGFKVPSDGALLVTKTLCIIFGYMSPPKVGQGKEKKDDWWTYGKQKVLVSGLLKMCTTLDKNNLDPARVEQLRPLISSPEYDDKKLGNASKAAQGLGRWVSAMVQFFDAMKIVKPKEAALAEAKAASDAAQKQWDEALAKLAAVQAEMNRLVEELDNAIAKEKKLTNDYETADRKCNRAKSLIEKLKDEEVNWAKELEITRKNKINVVGDIMLSAGVIAYMGVFTMDFRAEAIEQWKALCKEFDIKATETYRLEDTLGIGVKIQRWFIEGLPQEAFAVENAIIMDNSSRWPLMIDPQMQGSIWIKGMNKDNIDIIKPTMDADTMQKKLKICIQFGKPVLYEDANETFEPLVDPVLGQMKTKTGSMTMMKIGDEPVEYDEKFKLYVTTKLSKPHFAPEICVMVNILNMQVTLEGLKDQMLNLVLVHEEKKLMDKREQAIVAKAKNNEKKAQLEDKILEQISTSEVDILENDELMHTLDESIVQKKLMEQEEQQNKGVITLVDTNKELFGPVAERVARLFFVLIQVMQIDPMYQYSLKYFKQIYNNSLDEANRQEIPQGKKKERVAFFRDEFTRQLYSNICRSLFEKDKLLFSYLICLKIKDEVAGNLDQKEVRFLHVGVSKAETERPNPTGEGGWLTTKTWVGLNQLGEEYECFNGLAENFEKNLKEWERVYNLAKPQSKKAGYPAPFDQITLMQRGMLLRVLRPDKVIPVIQKLIKQEKELGKGFITPPTFDMRKTLADCAFDQPIIIVLSAGADPMAELQKLATIENQKITVVSLGQGQAEIAKNKIKEGQEQQQWVVLQNCHLSPSFMPTLDGIIERLQELDRFTKFRLWLTSMPSSKFPVTILQGGVKATIEPPRGLRNNLMRSYTQIDPNEFETAVESKPGAYKSLMWGLCFFNALILERRKYGPLGWNIQYEFSSSDLDISQAQLVMFLNFFDKIPWDALKYMVSEANYGGRVTDVNDRTCIGTLLEDFYCPAMLKKNHRMTESTKYVVPNEGDLQSYIDYISNEMPLNDETEVFGLHENAEITSAIGITQEMLEVALSVQGSGGGGGGGADTDAQVIKTCDEILAKLPQIFDLEQASKKHPITYYDSMNTVLSQELLRYNKLILVIKNSLIQAKQAIKGEIPLTPDLEVLLSQILNNILPDMWAKRSYPSLKPLASYYLDFLDRLAFIQKWIDEGAPANYWISGFYFTQSFMTGAKQNYARKYTIAIDTVDFSYNVISDETKTDITKPPEDGVYVWGLFLEGARWDNEKEALVDSHPKVLYSKMQTIQILPMKRAEIDFGHSYECPVYKTAKRAGTLSTTGHSTNFVMYCFLPLQKKDTERKWVKRGVAMLTTLSD